MTAIGAKRTLSRARYAGGEARYLGLGLAKYFVEYRYAGRCESPDKKFLTTGFNTHAIWNTSQKTDHYAKSG